jgi:hypothetical protein
VYVFAITKSDGVTGLVPDSAIAAQIAALNAAYAPWRIQFSLGATTRVANDAFWGVTLFSPADAAMKDALHKGTAQDLNVYVTLIGNSNLGYSSSPGSFNVQASSDGIVVKYITLPGMGPAGYL